MAPRTLAAVLLAVAACATPASRSPDIPLRVASYNIQAGGESLDGVVRAIRDLDADIIGLQEVDVHWMERSKFADQAAALGSALGMHVRFAPIYRIPNANASLPMREFGVALLSRLPVVEFRNENLTRLSTQQSNAAPTPMPGLLNAVVDVNGRRVRVLVTHLDYRADPSVRATQVAEMLQYIGAPDGPTLLLGDLNATPDAPELQPLFKRLADAWPPTAGVGLTYPAVDPVKRIDYVLHSSHFSVASATVIPALAADHQPVVVALRLAPSR